MHQTESLWLEQTSIFNPHSYEEIHENTSLNLGERGSSFQFLILEIYIVTHNLSEIIFGHLEEKGERST